MLRLGIVFLGLRVSLAATGQIGLAAVLYRRRDAAALAQEAPKW